MLARILYVVGGAAGLLLGTIGVLAAPEAALAGVLFGVLAGALVAIRTPDPQAPRGTLAAVAGPRAGLITGTTVLAGCLALAGLSTLLGSATGIVILALGLAAAAWWWLQRPDHPHHGHPDAPVADTVTENAAAAGVHERLPGMRPPPSLPATLSTEQLCLAWQRSYFTLLDTPAGSARCHIVALREGLLDELERRDHAGFTRWLDTDARAGSNPGHYLDAEHRPAPPAQPEGPRL